MQNTVSNVLIILPRQLGDILLGTSIARVLKLKFPNAKISWFAHPMGKQILNNHPFVDEVFYSKGEWATDVPLLWMLKRKNFDVIIDAMAIPRTAYITKFLNSKTRISFNTRWSRNFCYTHLVERSRLDEGYLGHTRLKLLEPLGVFEKDIPLEDKEPFLPMGEADKKKVDAFVEDSLKNKKFVVLSPTHRRPVRQWPASKYAELAQKLIQNENLNVVWLWGPGEESFVREIDNAVRAWCRQNRVDENMSVIPPLFNLRETAYLCGLAKCFVGNSNGLSHVAVAGGGKTVQLHGSTLAHVWTHPNKLKHTGIEAGCAAACMGKNICSNPNGRCLERLETQVVYEAARKLIFK